MCIPRATVSAVSCLLMVVPAFICIDLLISRVLKINDENDDEMQHTYIISCLSAATVKKHNLY